MKEHVKRKKKRTWETVDQMPKILGRYIMHAVDPTNDNNFYPNNE